MKNEKPLIDWPKEGPTRAPYRVMNDPDVYRLEQERIFRGPTWHYLCLEAEIPEPGDYRTTFIGEIPIIVTRDGDGTINALVNRCAHKGALLCIEPCGKRKEFACVYHAWTYDLKGNLTSIAFQRGLAGTGGMPADFDMKQHGLERVRVENFCGLVFGTFSDSVEEVEAHLGPDMAAQVRRVFNRPVEVIGYYHQGLPNNWKLYMENSRDPYHATILHAFYATFKLNRLSMLGGVALGHNGWHNLLYSAASRDIQKDNYQGKGLRSVIEDVGLADSSFLTRIQEFDDGITVAIQSIFPTCNIQQIYNTLAIRQTVPLGVEKAELHWTCFGYKDDDAELRRMRMLQANLIGPAGYVSMEDGSVGGYVQRGIAGAPADAAAVMEMGGRDIKASPGVRATETALRGFWQGYRDLMGF
jgi:anthranilate 1,2-dioxygenase large subunit/terephthalate 1,2-dioxygenase oxygenase component alpha subunit